MAHDHGQGIFTMDLINEVSELRDLLAAKGVAFAAIDNSSAKDSNKEKARIMVRQCATMHQLLLGMSNFSLSHQGLKTIR